ncbi:Uncharacterized protein FWK35_00010464, partial [Aphis craccivora]
MIYVENKINSFNDCTLTSLDFFQFIKAVREVKSKKCPIVFKSVRKSSKKVTEKREFLRKTSIRPNQFFYMVVIQKIITFKFLQNLSKMRKIAKLKIQHQIHENLPTTEISKVDKFPISYLIYVCHQLHKLTLSLEIISINLLLLLCQISDISVVKNFFFG